MDDYSISLIDQETVIEFSRTEESMTVYTTDSTIMARLDRCCKEAPDNYELINVGMINGRVVDKAYQIRDKGLLTFRLHRVKRDYSEEEKQKFIERMHKSHS